MLFNKHKSKQYIKLCCVCVHICLWGREEGHQNKNKNISSMSFYCAKVMFLKFRNYFCHVSLLSFILDIKFSIRHNGYKLIL